MKGKLFRKFDTITRGAFSSREFVLETDEKYPQMLKMQVLKDNCAKLDNIEIGSSLEVEINLKGRMWTNPKGEEVFFNTLDAWKITLLNDSSAPVSEPLQSDNETDDLVF